MTGITWSRVEALMAARNLKVDATAAPVSPVGGTTPGALPIAGLVEAQAVRDAFASVGWTVKDGHEWSLTAGFDCDGIPTSMCLSFDQAEGRVRSWVSAAVAVRANDDQVATDGERDLLAALLEFAETPFPSMSGIIRLGRGLAYPDVPEEFWPTPFVQAVADWNVLVPEIGGLRYEPVDPPVRTLVIGYHWGWIPDESARATVITRAVDHLPTVLVATRDLCVQDPDRFRGFMGASIPSLQLAIRLSELQSPRSSLPGTDAPSVPPQPATLSSTGTKIGKPATSAPTFGAFQGLQTRSPRAKFCGECGSARADGARFCGECGSAFADDPQRIDVPSTPTEADPNDDAPLTESAREMLERSAVQGDSLAMWMLSHDSQKRGDEAGARRWLEMSAKTGNPDTMAVLAANAIQEGNPEEARYWMQQAAEAGHVLAMAWMGSQALDAGEWVDARTWLEPAAAAGQANAKVSLGILERAEGNPNRARDLFAEAADDGEAGAMFQLGLLSHEEGNPEEAERWWLASAEQGDADSMHALGVIAWQDGRVDVAIRWMTQAAKTGHLNAMRARATMAEEQGDMDTHRLWLTRSAENGHAESQNDLGSALVHEGRLEEGLALLEAAARQGRPWALASHSWALLKAGDYARAVSLADEVLPTCEEFLLDSQGDAEIAALGPEQLANARSNIALCRLALGGDEQVAESAWREGADTGHLESLFYPAVMARREHRQHVVSTVVDSLSAEQRREMRETLNELMEGGDAWLVGWCRDGLNILEGSAPAGPICAQCGAVPPATARFCPECGTGLGA